ncbi:glutamine-rich protein 2-like isoform X2 [Vidua chalybeata]|uniref:glutamine-rich protein 2-like isoform X2 n=1 Tax=Vidua chalybeata TaxID=81927 RepID=UPI0023A89350|nr:glutamine-rich protein 2-like isoform X2 [Vidua chalybeata]
MGEQQEMRNAMLEQLVTETANKVNEQLGSTGETTVGLLEELEGENGDCSSCTFNIRAHLGKLLQRCEKLQEKVECLESRQMAMGKLKKMMRNWGQLEHDHERLRYMEATVVRMKGDCEKLSFVSGTLQKDSEQKQKAIEMLFQSLEKLQKEKTDEQDVLAAIDVKADKAALGSKVNCSQFEANMDRLDERMQELQSRISDQEQHFNTMQQQLNLVVEEKLDRLELKTFSSHMEDSWKRNMEELALSGPPLCPKEAGGPWQCPRCATELWGPSEQQFQTATHSGLFTEQGISAGTRDPPQQASCSLLPSPE